MPVSWPDHVDEILGGGPDGRARLCDPGGRRGGDGGRPDRAARPRARHGRASPPRSGSPRSSTASGASRAWRSPTTRASTGSSSRPEYVLVQGRAEPVERAHARATASWCAGTPSSHLGEGRSGRVLGPLAARVLHGARSRCGCTWSGSPCGPTCDCAGRAASCYGLPEPAPRRPIRSRRRRRAPAARGHARARPSGCARRRTCCSATSTPTATPRSWSGRAASPRTSTGLELAAAPGVIPAGARRAGLLGHDYRPQLVGLTARQHTGWLEAAGRRGLYAPALGDRLRGAAQQDAAAALQRAAGQEGVRKARRAGKLPA